MQIAEKRMTINEFEKFLEAHTEDGNIYELYDGELLTMTGAKPGHNWIAQILIFAMYQFAAQSNKGWAMQTPGVKPFAENDTLYFPDGGFFSIERLESPYSDEYIPFSPDIAIEVVSPGNDKEEIANKVLDYLATGSKLVWVIYPVRRNVIVYRANKTFDALEEPKNLDGEDVLPGFTFPIKDLFKKKK